MNCTFLALAFPVVFFCPLVGAQIEEEQSAPMTYSLLRGEEAAANALAVIEPVRIDWVKIQEKGRSLPEIQKRSQSVAINLQSRGTGVADKVQPLIDITNRASLKLMSVTKLALDANDAVNEAISATGTISQHLKETYLGTAYMEQMRTPGVNHLLRTREAEKLLDATRQKRTIGLRNARALNDEMRRAQITHQKLLAEYQTADRQGKTDMSIAIESDLAAQRVATIAARAAGAFSDSAQLAATELKLARVIVESQILIANETLTKAEMLAKKP